MGWLPNSSELQYLIWDDYKVPNHSDLTTIYPPLSLYVFRILSFYSLDYGNYQYVFCSLDILVIWLNPLPTFLFAVTLCKM